MQENAETVAITREMTDNVSNYEYRAPRFRGDFALLLQTPHPHSALLQARCIDLSEDGFAAEIITPELSGADVPLLLPVGAKVSIVMTLPGNSKSTTLWARVTNHQVGSYGFAFVFASKAEQNYMHEYVESYSRSIRRSSE